MRISANEWKKARHFDAHLCLFIVTGAKTDAPEPPCIQNPDAHFRMDEDIQAMGHIVQEDVWSERLTYTHQEEFRWTVRLN